MKGVDETPREPKPLDDRETGSLQLLYQGRCRHDPAPPLAEGVEGLVASGRRGEICEMLLLCSGVTLNSGELPRSEPDFLNYLPLSVNRNTHP